MNADGTNKHVLYDPEPENPHVPPLAGRHASWSPDGSKVVFDVCAICSVNTNSNIYLFNTKTKEVKRLTEFKKGVSNMYPVWSPNGTRIALTSDRAYPDEGGSDLFIMDSDGSNLNKLTSNIYVGSKSWYPDGSKIYFAGFKEYSNINLYLYKLNTNELLKLDIGIMPIRPIEWSKNVKYLLLAKTEDSNKVGLYIYNTVIDSLIHIPFKTRYISGIDWFTSSEK